MEPHPKALNPLDWKREKCCGRLEVKEKPHNNAKGDANKGQRVTLRRKL